MGESFALQWHALEFKKYVICSDSVMFNILNEYKKFDVRFLDPDSIYSRFTLKILDSIKLFKIDSYITIKMLPDKCFITWYELETHHGIFRRTYLIYRSAPYLVEKVFDEKLANIETGFDY